MSSALQANLQSIADAQPELFEFLRPHLKEPTAFRIQEADGAIHLFEGEKIIDSTESRFWEATDFPSKSVLLLHAFGLGVNLQRALETQAKTIVIVEPSVERFLYSLSLTQFGELWKNPNIVWLIGQAPEACFSQLFSVFRKVPRSLYMEDFAFIPHPALTVAYQAYFDRLEDEYQALRNQIQRNYGNLRDSLLGFKNSIENISFIESTPGIASLYQVFKDIPAVVVSAGPSLKKSLPKLKELSKKAVLIANDATCSVLLDCGIDPHFVCSIERMPGSKRFLEAVPSTTRASLVAYPIVPKEVIEAFPGRKICAYRDYTYFRFFQGDVPRGIFPSSSSVAHMCANLASYLGCSPIVLVGQDLCFDLETLQSHVDGIAIKEFNQKKSVEDLERELKDRKEQGIVWLPGNIEEKVPSMPTYFSFLKEFSYEALRLKSRLINATEGGASIPGVPWIKIEELAATWTELPSVFDRIDEVFDEDPYAALNLKPIIGMLGDFRARLDSLLQQTQSFGPGTRLDPKTGAQVLELLKTSKLEFASHQAFSAFVIEMNAAEFLRIENQLACSQGREFQYQLKLLAEWFQSMRDALQQVLSILPSSK